LNPSWYKIALIRELLYQASHDSSACNIAYQRLALAEVLISNAVLRYNIHMTSGFFNPQEAFRKFYALPLTTIDSTFMDILYRPDLTATRLLLLEPKDSIYLKLQEAYLIYKGYYWDSIPDPDTSKVSLGDTSFVLNFVAKRLMVTGELDSSYKDFNFTHHDSVLAAAVIRFQQNNNLLADGVIGGNTLKELNVSADQRAEQIAVNMERWRWNKLQWDGKYLKINIPEFTLYAFHGDTFKFAARVCVGEKKEGNYDEKMKRYLKSKKKRDMPNNHETPCFMGKITHVVLNPDWLVPTNIVEKELYSHFRKDTSYIRLNDYKVYLDDVEVNPDSIDWSKYNPERLPFRVKQDPGEINALGKIKFVFFNPYDVFLHDTPNRKVFDRAYRAVSHGCVRLDKPFKMVEFLIDGNKKWEPDDVRMALGMPPEDDKDKRKFKKKKEEFKKWKEAFEKDSVKLETEKIFLKTSVPIVIDYRTVFVDTMGVVRFCPDVYRRDPVMLRRLSQADE
jgi:murein L,D-transpeptidase YcbB/YkuD